MVAFLHRGALAVAFKIRLYPDATTIATNASITGAASVHAAADDPWYAVSPLDYFFSSNSTADMTVRVTLGNLDPLFASLVVNFVEVVGYNRYSPPTPDLPRYFKQGVNIGGVDYFGAQQVTNAPPPNPLRTRWTFRPDVTTLPWDYTTLNATSLVVVTNDAVNGGFGTGKGGLLYDAFFLEIDADMPTGDMLAVQEAMTRKLGMRRRGRKTLKLRVPAALFARYDLGWRRHVRHALAPFEALTGWPITDPRYCVIYDIEEDPKSKTLLFTLVDLRWDLSCYTLWEIGKSRWTASFHGVGLAYHARQQARVVLRNSIATAEEPGNPVRKIVPVQVNRDVYDVIGNIIASPQTNYILNSSFKEGLTGWAPLLGGGGAAAGAFSPSPLMHSDLTPNFVYLNVGPLVGNYAGIFQAATASVPAGKTLCFWVEHLEVASGSTILNWRLQRTADAMWWNDTTGLWQAGAVTNNFGPSTDFVMRKNYSKPITAYGAPTTFNVNLYRDGGTSDQGQIYHVQLEDGALPTPHIITPSTGAVARLVHKTYYPQANSTQWLIPRVGSFLQRINPLWTTGWLLTDKVFVSQFIDANNKFEFKFNNGAFQLQANVTIAGVTATAYYPMSVNLLQRGVEFTLGVRWTDSLGMKGVPVGLSGGLKEDVPPYSLDIFLNGSPGVRATMNGPFPQGSTELYIGSDNAGLGSADAGFVATKILPYWLSQQEMYRAHIYGF